MKIGNFKLLSVEGQNSLDWVAMAEVTVTTGFLFWKKTNVRLVQRRYAAPWFFVDTGKFTPGYEVEELERSWGSQNGEIFVR